MKLARRRTNLITHYYNQQGGAFTDDFNRADGALGGGWSGATWSIVDGVAINTPTESAEWIANPTLEGVYSSGVAPSWQNFTSATLAEEGTIVHGGSKSQKVTTDTTGYRGVEFANTVNTQTLGRIYKSSGYIYPASGSVEIWRGTGPELVRWQPAGWSGEWRRIHGCLRGGTTGGVVRMRYTNQFNIASVYYVDDASYKELSMPTLIAVRDSGRATYTVKCAFNRASYQWSGVATRVDDTANPQNAIIVFHNGTQICVGTIIAGVFSYVGTNNTVTYVPGAALVVDDDGTDIIVTYNGVQIRTDEITTVAMTSYVGMFSTDAENEILFFEANDYGEESEQIIYVE